MRRRSAYVRGRAGGRRDAAGAAAEMLIALVFGAFVGHREAGGPGRAVVYDEDAMRASADVHVVGVDDRTIRATKTQQHSERRSTMKLGLQIPYFTWPGGPPALGAKLGEIARAAEDAGYASIWVMDHFFQIPMVGAAEMDMLEAYTTLGLHRGAHVAGEAGHAGDGRDVPPPGHPREAGDDAGRAVGRARVPGHRRGVVRPRARRASACRSRR